MRVLHILRSPRAEGTVKLVLDWLATRTIAQGVLLLETQPAEMTEQIRARADWVDAFDTLPKGAAKFPFLVRNVFRTCRHRRPDLVICWPNGFSSWVLLGARAAGVRRLITHAGNPPTPTPWGRVQTVWSTWVAAGVGGRMICCSRYVASAFQESPGAFQRVLRVVYNCAPVDQIRQQAARARRLREDVRPRLIMVATMEAHKDHATLIRAMVTVKQQIPEVELWLAGEGRLRASLETLVADLDLRSTVRFLGSRNDVPALLGQSDAFVFSTTPQEGLGTVLIEALAAGLPVVASDVPACREALAEGAWGTLVAPADARSLATALVETLQRRPTSRAEERAEALRRFEPESMMAGYLATVGLKP